jgi:POT family proton-dependent oligopeptide transporter
MATDIETQNTDLGRHDMFEEKAPVAESDWANLQRVPDKLPKIALLILAVEVCVSTLFPTKSH